MKVPKSQWMSRRFGTVPLISGVFVERGSLLHFVFPFFSQIPCNRTYLVLRRRGASRSDHVYRFNKAASLGLLEPLSPVREFAISVVTNRYPLSPQSQNLNGDIINVYIFICYFWEKSFSGFWFLYHNSDCRYFESFVILTILANCVFLVVECAPEEAE